MRLKSIKLTHFRGYTAPCVFCIRTMTRHIHEARPSAT